LIKVLDTVTGSAPEHGIVRLVRGFDDYVVGGDEVSQVDDFHGVSARFAKYRGEVADVFDVIHLSFVGAVPLDFDFEELFDFIWVLWVFVWATVSLWDWIVDSYDNSEFVWVDDADGVDVDRRDIEISAIARHRYLPKKERVMGI
jgi:hypothetical protein